MFPSPTLALCSGHPSSLSAIFSFHHFYFFHRCSWCAWFFGVLVFCCLLSNFWVEIFTLCCILLYVFPPRLFFLLRMVSRCLGWLCFVVDFFGARVVLLVAHFFVVYGFMRIFVFQGYLVSIYFCFRHCVVLHLFPFLFAAILCSVDFSPFFVVLLLLIVPCVVFRPFFGVPMHDLGSSCFRIGAILFLLCWFFSSVCLFGVFCFRSCLLSFFSSSLLFSLPWQVFPFFTVLLASFVCLATLFGSVWMDGCG